MEKKELKIGILVGLTFTFFVLELVGGYVVSSIALVADSFHMLSDVASLIIALVATRLSKSKNFGSDLSYGLQRAEVLGALINGVSLLALCFTLIISAVQRLFTPEEISNPFIVLYVASAGLIVNIIGLTLFHNHSHSGHNHAFKRVEEVDPMILLEEAENPIYFRENVIRVAEKIMERQGGGEFGIDHEEISSPAEMQNSCTTIDNHDHDGGHTHHGHHDLNMHGVFLHVLGDLLASVGVIVSAVIIIYIKDPWTLCIF